MSSLSPTPTSGLNKLMVGKSIVKLVRGTWNYLSQTTFKHFLSYLLDDRIVDIIVAKVIHSFKLS